MAQITEMIQYWARAVWFWSSYDATEENESRCRSQNCDFMESIRIVMKPERELNGPSGKHGESIPRMEKEEAGEWPAASEAQTKRFSRASL